MTKLLITDKDFNENNLNYINTTLTDLFMQTDSSVTLKQMGSRYVLAVETPEFYFETVKAEIIDRVADIITVNYKYEYFKRIIKPSGLNKLENELLLTSLISADFEEDKRYAVGKLKGFSEIAIDGMYNFRLKPLKKKWEEITEYMPDYFVNSQLKEFITYLLEDKKKRVYIEENKVYDMHYRRLVKGALMDNSIEEGKIVREVILSGSGEVELNSKVSELDEFYLKEYYGDKIILNRGYFL